MVVIRTFQVDLGNTYPANLHELALDLVSAMEAGRFKLSSDDLVRGDILHGGYEISWPSPQDIPPFLADVTITFFDETAEEDAQTAGDVGDRSVPKGGLDYKKRPLASYPPAALLKTRAEAFR